MDLLFFLAAFFTGFPLLGLGSSLKTSFNAKRPRPINNSPPNDETNESPPVFVRNDLTLFEISVTIFEGSSLESMKTSVLPVEESWHE